MTIKKNNEGKSKTSFVDVLKFLYMPKLLMISYDFDFFFLQTHFHIPLNNFDIVCGIKTDFSF